MEMFGTVFGTIWLLCMIIGTALAAGKGRAGSGLVWTFLFGPLGVLIVILLPNLKKKEQDRQKKQFDEQMRLQKAQLQQLEALSKAPATAPPPSNKPDLSYRVARNGEDIGEMPLSKISALLRAQKLAKTDYYFDTQLKEWVAIEFLDGVS